MAFAKHAGMAFLAVALLTTSVAAQCPMPDGLDGGPCCTDAQVILPAFPKIDIDTMQLCWRNCDVENVDTCRGIIGRPRPLNTGVHCGRFRARINLRDSSNTRKWKGKLNFTYSRTWFEADGVDQRLQVWRFLVHGNLKALAAAGSPPCPVPPCASQFNDQVRFTGYVDYAQDCVTGEFSHAWMLTHACDAIDHAPGFPRAGLYHPDRSYSFVAPAASFAVGPIQPVEAGGTGLEAVRRLRVPMAGSIDTNCEFEERIDCGLQPIQTLCLCGSPNGPAQYVISDLGLGGACGTSIFTPGGPYLPGFISMGLGMWTDPATYPGLEILRWNTGGYDYFDPCVGTTRREVFFGVSTIRGYEATQIFSGGFGAPLPLTFVDQGNSLFKADGVSTAMNVNYVSDHILNLNFQ